MRKSAINNSLLDLTDASQKMARRGSVGSLDSGMSISFQSNSIFNNHQQCSQNNYRSPRVNGGPPKNNHNINHQDWYSYGAQFLDFWTQCLFVCLIWGDNAVKTIHQGLTLALHPPAAKSKIIILIISTDTVMNQSFQICFWTKIKIPILSIYNSVNRIAKWLRKHLPS